MTALADTVSSIVDSVSQVIVGKRPQIERVAVAMLCGGHVLIDDVPGTGKTMLARSFAASMGLEFRRLQCTPDLLPNDVTGVRVFDPRSGEFRFEPGPIFANILLADEINRATPRTQAALLEAMAEGQVTVDGETRRLPEPFLVLATQNPVEFEGTFPLPEAQLDRFMMSMSLGYPTAAEEQSLLSKIGLDHPVNRVKPVAEFEDAEGDVMDRPRPECCLDPYRRLGRGLHRRHHRSDQESSSDRARGKPAGHDCAGGDVEGSGRSARQGLRPA